MRILCLILMLLWPAVGVAQTRAATEQQFRVWLDQVVWPRANAQGVARDTFQRAFDGVVLNWDLPDLVPPGMAAAPQQSQQSEFGAPGRYFNAGSVDGATSVGRQMAGQHAGVLSRVEAATGVPGRIILGVWGRESGYGRADIPYDVFAVLGTMGFMSTRAAYFTDELVAALMIAQRGASPRALKSSWAGAMGQPQFMPSNYLAYATDGDGDGRADIWGSAADTIASIGTYLQRHGWVAGRDWGFEVTVPATVSCALEGPDQGRLISDWAAAGVQRTSGAAFPAHELRAVGFLMMPAGRNGPAFIVTPNFYALKQYNNSDLYALFVGHVGDRIQYGSGGFAGRWGDVGGLRRSDVAAMQRGLESLGHDVGGADGLAGFKTRRSIGRWQAATGQGQTCFPDARIVAALARR